MCGTCFLKTLIYAENETRKARFAHGRTCSSYTMVNATKQAVHKTSNKKRVTFSLCSDKSDPCVKVPTQYPDEVPNRLSKYVDTNSECNNKSWNSGVITSKKTVISEAVNISGKVCDVKKTLVRNVEQVLPPHCALVRRRPYPSIPVNSSHNKPLADAKSTYKSKYAAPELYTTLCIAKEIQDTAKTDGKRSSSFGIPPPAKQMLDGKILSKLNFPFEETLYRDLVSLTVHDEELLSSESRPGSQRDIEFRQYRDDEPQLRDFYTPSDGKQYSVVEKPPAHGMERIRHYNGFSLYERSHMWFHD